jgi:hypothetical protein
MINDSANNRIKNELPINCASWVRMRRCLSRRILPSEIPKNRRAKHPLEVINVEEIYLFTSASHRALQIYCIICIPNFMTLISKILSKSQYKHTHFFPRSILNLLYSLNPTLIHLWLLIIFIETGLKFKGNFSLTNSKARRFSSERLQILCIGSRLDVSAATVA